jgi:hypothetical protein
VGRHRDPGQPRDPLVQIEITLTVPRQSVWLLAGAAVSHLYALGSSIETVGHVLRALTGLI